jgi:hypothetical protein
MLSEQEVDRAAIAAYSRYRELSPNRRIETVEWVYLNEHDRNDWRDSAQAAVEAVLTQRTDGATDGAALIAAERKRQIESEKWTAEHDDEHDAGQMVEAAVTYALEATYDGPALKGTWFKKYWPWDDESFKPKNPPQDLIRAGALIAAEIDRLQRATQRTEPAPAQEHLGADRTDEWESHMDAQKQAAQAVPQSALLREAKWNRITWPCDRSDFLAWRPREDGVGIEVLIYNYANRQLPSGDGLFYVADASSLMAIGRDEPVQQSAGNNSSGAEQINVPQCTAPVQQSVGAEDVVERMLDAWYGDSEGFLPYDELQRVHMTAALAEARKGLHSEAEIEKALQDEVEQWPGYESWYKCFTKDVLARLNAHKEERVTVEKEMR